MRVKEAFYDFAIMLPMRIDLGGLNARQREAAETIEGPVLVLSGAGTGKTRTITYRIANMLGKGISPGNILAVTFTNKAAAEMAERIRALAGEAAKEMQISTFHSLGLKIIRENTEYFELPYSLTIYDTADQVAVARKGLRELKVPNKKFDPDKILWQMNSVRTVDYGKIAPKCEDPDDAWAIQHLWPYYRETLKKCGAVDFEDLLFLPLQLFKARKDILAKYQERFRYALVDEYQDTNEAQFELMRLLTIKSRNLCAVGDDDQSIYGWRGAVIRNILDFEKNYKEAKVIRLEENYRSTQTILDAANCVIKNNKFRKAKTLFTANGQGEKVKLYCAENEESECARLTELITDLHAKKVPFGDIAILMRTNTQSMRYEEALRRARIPYVLKGNLSFLDRKEMRDFLGYLKLMVNTLDEEAVMRVINIPKRKIGATSLKKLSDFAGSHNWDLYTALGHIEECEEIKGQTKEAMKSFHNLVERYRGLVRPGNYARFVRDLWEDLNYEQEISELDTADREERLGNVSQLIESISYFERENPNSGLDDYLQQLHLQEEDEEDDDDKDMKDKNKVKMMTIHSSKGLEFPYVFIVGVNDGILPHERSVNEGGLEEERRLFYVAITRAKKDLFLLYPAERTRYGVTEACEKSRFIEEIDEELLETYDETVPNEVTDEEEDEIFAKLKGMLDKK